MQSSTSGLTFNQIHSFIYERPKKLKAVLYDSTCEYIVSVNDKLVQQNMFQFRILVQHSESRDTALINLLFAVPFSICM